MSDREARRLAWTVWSAATALAATGAVLVLLGLDASVPDNWGFRGYFDLLAVFVATPGLVVARHQPRNAIGWLLLVAGLSAGFGGFAQEYSTRAVLIARGSLPGAIALAWLASWSFSFFVAPLLTLIPQLFPTGRPLGPRWKPLQWCGVAVPLLMLFLFGLSPGPLENATFIEAGMLGSNTRASQILMIVAVLTLPVAIAIAILRYRLYDIGLLINRTLVYGALSAALAATYFGAVILIQAVLRPFTSGNELAVAGSTLLVVALFQPLRRRVQGVVDRRFYRSATTPRARLTPSARACATRSISIRCAPTCSRSCTTPSAQRTPASGCGLSPASRARNRRRPLARVRSRGRAPRFRNDLRTPGT